MSQKIISYPTPNQDARPQNTDINTLVIHYTGMRNLEEALARMQDPIWKVSAHWCIGEDGTIYQLVPEKMRAWHAGVSWWRGQKNLNDNSIGIEIVNPGHEFGYRPFRLPQMNSLINLCKEICRRNPINPRNVVAHSDIAPGRKMDPGELFDWERLAKEGIGLWPNSLRENNFGAILKINDKGKRVLLFQKMLSQFGYGLYQDGVYGPETKLVVTAFQRHYRQARVDGNLDSGTSIILESLINKVNI